MFFESKFQSQISQIYLVKFFDLSPHSEQCDWVRTGCESKVMACHEYFQEVQPSFTKVSTKHSGVLCVVQDTYLSI